MGATRLGSRRTRRSGRKRSSRTSAHPRKEYPLPRPSKPWYRKSSGTWVSRVNGRLRTLAHGKANRAEASRQLALLLGGGPGQSVEDGKVQVNELARQFLGHLGTWARPKTIDTYRQFL